ncbi:MAG: Ig-like domain-containing protein, partial [Pirellulaceae bacterium]
AGTSDSEIMTMVGNGEGTASRYDRDLFKYGFLDVPHGNNVATIVSFEQTGNSNIQRVPGLFTSTIVGAGLGDLDHDGDYDLDDVNRFGAIYRSGEAEFYAAGDFTADGLTTYADLLAMIARLKEVEADVVTVAAAEDLQAEFFGAVDDAFSTDEDSVLVVDPPGILGNDLDPGMEGSLNLETTGEVETALGGTATFDANGRLHYVPPESLQALSSGTSIKDSGSYTVNDGLGTTSTATVEITVNGVNNAPVVVNKEISFPNIAEDNMDPPGKPVSWILDNLGYSDADDNAERGIAITTFDYDALGRLQKSTDSGTSWQDAPDVPEGKALLLADSAMVRVVPNGEYGGSGEIEFYGWDQTYDASGRVVQLTDRGGRNAFSIASGTVDFSIQDVNNVPTLDAIADPAAIDEDAAQQTVGLAGITSGAANEDQPLRVTASSSNPSLIKDPTVVYTSKDPTGTLKYTPEANQSGITTITVTVEDGGLDKDLATTEDNATFSRTFDVTVTTVNDTPEVTDGVFEPTENVLFVRDAASGLSTLVNDADGDELTFTLVDSTRHGELVLAADGSFSYMPDANFNRTDSFTFKVNDGTVDSEVVTVTLNMQTNFPWHNGALWGDVNDDGRVNVADAMGVVQIVLGSEHAALPADEGLRPIQAPFYDMNRDGEITAEDFEVLKDHINLTQSPVGRVRVLPTDEGGELLRQVQVGENFWLSMLLMDIRLDAKGVFASYVRVHYDKDTVQVTGDPLFVSPYENGPHFDRSSAGLVNEVGATASLSELGADEYLQFRLPMKATSEGLGSFTLSPAQDSPDHDFLVYGWDYPVATRQVNLGTSTLLIHPSSGGEGEAPLELYAFTAPSPRPLLAQPARRSLFDWVAREPGDVARYREAVDDAMRTVVKQPAPVLYRSAVQRIDGLEHGEEEADLLDEILVDEVFSGAGLPGE